ERVAYAPAVECGFILAHPGDRPSHLPDREVRERGLEPHRMIDRDVDHGIGELRHVAGAEVVPPAVRERWVEHALMLEERLRSAEVELRRAEPLERPDDPLPVLWGSRVAAHDANHQLAVQLRWDERKRRSLPVRHDGHQLLWGVGDPVAVEAEDLRRLLYRPEDGP